MWIIGDALRRVKRAIEGRVNPLDGYSAGNPCIAAGFARRRGMSSDPVTPPPDAARLHEAALNYLARYASTEAGLRRVLNGKIDRWVKAHPERDPTALRGIRASVDQVIERVVAAGLVSDVGFAEMRSKSLVRSGQSRRGVHARLIAKGVSADIARSVLPDDMETELAAAIVTTRRRRIGPYRTNSAEDGASRAKELARLARAGFSRDVAERALDMSLEEADRRIKELRR